jgi:HAD superfamily hydrolase (TIGR01509 family)
MMRAYIFDLDGTLVDSEVIWTDAIADYLRGHKIEFSQQDAAQLVYGRSWRDIHGDIVRMYPKLHMPIEAMEAAVYTYYEGIASQRDIRISTSVELLKRLSSSYPVCIVSGSSRKTIGEAVSLMGIDEHLEFFLGAEDYSPGKPDPVCYRLAADKLGLDAEDCLVFEDSQAGLNAANAAGMTCVVLTRCGRPSQDFTLADLVLDDLANFREEDF